MRSKVRNFLDCQLKHSSRKARERQMLHFKLQEILDGGGEAAAAITRMIEDTYGLVMTERSAKGELVPFERKRKVN